MDRAHLTVTPADPSSAPRARQSGHGSFRRDAGRSRLWPQPQRDRTVHAWRPSDVAPGAFGLARSGAIELVWDILLPVASAALLLFGGAEVLAGRLSIGDVMMFIVYLAMLLEPLAVLVESSTAFQSNLAGLERVLDLLAEPRNALALGSHDG